MAFKQADLDDADEDVARDRRYITTQHRIISGLTLAGLPTDYALELLAELERSLVARLAKRDAIQAALHPVVERPI